MHHPEDSTVQAHIGGTLAGAIVAKTEAKIDRTTGEKRTRGYVAMLAVDRSCRRSGLGIALGSMAIGAMAKVCDEVSIVAGQVKRPG